MASASIMGVAARLRNSVRPYVGGHRIGSAYGPPRPSVFRWSSSSTPDSSGRKLIRNIGISAHIDSGKTTLTERILYYTGRIGSIHDVRGKDGVGAKMDSMDLEREKGITIQSAATHCMWGGAHVNIIDTPGHVDFTVEVERALRVLDGGVMVLCGVSGVQSQSLTVDRQMKRYGVPRVAFVNKLDRTGANPHKVLGELRSELALNAAAVQAPIGLEGEHVGVVDIVEHVGYVFEGERGEEVVTVPVPAAMEAEVAELRRELIERLADVDEAMAETFIMEEDPTATEIRAAIRRQTLACQFVPVFLGSAYKNKGVQRLLDGVLDYLPAPHERTNMALDVDNDEEQVALAGTSTGDLVALAFKLEETQFGQITYVRIYQGTLTRGTPIRNVSTGKKVKVPRIVRMHSAEMEDIDTAAAGDVVALFGVECKSMDTFGSTANKHNLVMSSMFVAEPVMSLSITPARGGKNQDNFGKGLGKFTKEDPTLRVKLDPATQETIISGMGELHLEVYIERLRREYEVECTVGRPTVSYKETINKKREFDFTHKKQTGGSGQYAKVIGYIEPMTEEEVEECGAPYEFDNRVVGTNIPPEYLPSCGKGVVDAMQQGALVGAEGQAVRVVLLDGASHQVDSSDMAFRFCMASAVRKAMREASPSILEPVMKVEVVGPEEFQGTIIAGLNRRMGLIQTAGVTEDGRDAVIIAEVPLNQMFGYSTDIRSATQGKGTFTMEYARHTPVTRDAQEELIKKHQEERDKANAA